MVSAEKQLTMPPQKKSKKNTPTETDEENHYTEEDNGISFTAEPSQIIDQEIRAKLEALQKARAEKVEHTLEPFAEEIRLSTESWKEYTKKVQQLQKEKERFANQLEAKRRDLEKLEKLNQAKEQIERMQRKINEIKEQENSSLWHDSSHQNSSQNKRTPKENFFVGNGISQFADPDSSLSLGLQTAPWPPKFKPVAHPKYKGYGNSRQFLMRYESVVNSAGGDDVALAKSFIISCEGPVLN
jgi:hypothetical protein